jgi:hypothetical protein
MGEFENVDGHITLAHVTPTSIIPSAKPVVTTTHTRITAL